MNTQESNKLIAEFMGLSAIRHHEANKENMYSWLDEIRGQTILLPPSKMNYERSWDWLMPVVEKIENLGFEFFIIENRCKVSHNTDNSIEVLSYLEGGSKIQITYQTVIEFIKWHNEQN